ncbi:unnamed protein product [Pieris macdunnoughi]|uniref:C2H2-type domain-containing protein n=1 Tax=Pieris macdunnoughi TaxID=345717 RepID=A0A821VVH4_9NEOP|nr:unnamed protein product [Pieris macdunnoughi]
MTEQSSTIETNVSETKDTTVKLDMPPPSTTIVLKRLRTKFYCTACEKSYKAQAKLKYHIRSKHFNLKTKTTNIDKKNINDVWFEKVVNTDFVAEIKKASYTKLIIRRSESREVITDIKEIVDVSEQYPTKCFDVKAECNECHQIICKKDFKKHFKLKHSGNKLKIKIK